MRCPHCGWENPHGNHHCGSCGAALPVNGFYQQPYSSYTPCPSPISPMPISPVSPSHRWVAFVLCFFFGILGIHRFYVGKVGTGLLYLFTGDVYKRQSEGPAKALHTWGPSGLLPVSEVRG